MRLFNASLHRTATQSFAAACSRNGIACAHWLGAAFDEECRPFLGNCDLDALWRSYAARIVDADACADLPCPILYRQAARAYPSARFLVVERRPTRWLASVRRHTAGRALTVIEQLSYWWLTGERRDRLDQYAEAQLLAAYVGHSVRATAELRALGVSHALLSLDAPDFAARIADFAGFAMDRRFPHVDHLSEDAAGHGAGEAAR